MIKSILSITAVMLTIIAGAQENQEPRKEVQQEVADKFPAARVFDIQFQQYLPSDFNSDLNDRPFENGTIQNHYKLKAAANIPFYKKPKWMLTASFNYKYEGYELDNVQQVSAVPIADYDKTPEFHYLSAAMSFTYYSSLFKKPFIYNASILTDGSERSAERIKGLIAGSLVLKRTENTTMTVGLVIFIDPASAIPLTPSFTLEHRFKNTAWTLDFILPQRLLFKRPVGNNGRISLGTELGSDGFYVYLNQPGLARVYDYRQLELKSGITYEHKVSEMVIATFRTGLSTVFNSRLSERGKSTNDYIWKSQQDGTAYFTLGLSFNPFVKKTVANQ